MKKANPVRMLENQLAAIKRGINHCLPESRQAMEAEFNGILFAIRSLGFEATENDKGEFEISKIYNFFR